MVSEKGVWPTLLYISLIKEETLLHEEFCGNLVSKTILHYYQDNSTVLMKGSLFQGINPQLFPSFNAVGRVFFYQ